MDDSVSLDSPPLSDEWIDSLLTAANDRGRESSLSGFDGCTIRLKSGRKSQSLVVNEGKLERFGDKTEADPNLEISIPLTEDQLGGLMNHTFSLATSYMQGQIKPVGSTRALLAAVGFLDAP